MATPRWIHTSGATLGDGTSTARMKLVDTPVVDSVPARAVVLYSGQRYVGTACAVDADAASSAPAALARPPCSTGSRWMAGTAWGRAPTQEQAHGKRGWSQRV